MKLALQHYPKWWWYLDLCGLLYLTHCNPWKQQANVVCFQQFLYCEIPEFILVPLTDIMKLSMLKLLLIIFLANELFCESQMSIQMMAMSNLGKTLHTQDFETILMLLKI